MIDIDCHKAGSYEGALRYEAAIKEFFPNTVFEKSTNGNGRQGFIILKSNCIRLWDRVLQWLQSLAEPFVLSGDIEMVELKGKPPVFQYDGKLININMGQLAKLPRCDISTTAILTAFDIQQLYVPKPKPAVKRPRIAGSNPCAASKELANIEAYRGKSSHVMACAKKIHHRRLIDDDAKVLFAFLDFCTKHPNPDGSIPVKRIEAMWRGAYENGIVNVYFHTSKLSSLLKAMTICGYINWQNKSYYYDGDGVTEGARQFSLKEKQPVIVDVSDILQRERESTCNPVYYPFLMPIIAILTTKDRYYRETG